MTAERETQNKIPNAGTTAIPEERPLEHELIREYRAGNDAAFDRLVEATKAEAFARAYWFCGNREDALDVVQEAYIKLLKMLHRWDYSCTVRTWLYRVVTNACIDLHRRRQTRLQVDADDVRIALGHSQSEDLGNPSRVVMSREQVMELHEHIRTLPPRMRQCIELRYLDGKSLVEVAAVQQCALGTIKATLFQGLRKLRAAVASAAGLADASHSNTSP